MGDVTKCILWRDQGPDCEHFINGYCLSNLPCKEATKNILCPQCNGEKESMGFVCRGDGCDVKPLGCILCRGQGKVDYGKYSRWLEGQNLVADRKARGETLRSEAERLGISMTKLSKRERGEL